MNLGLLIPTRGRPENVLRLLKSVRDTASVPKQITTYLWIDDDDSSADGHMAYFAAQGAKIHRGPRMQLSHVYNRLTELSDDPILFSGADDIVFRTQAWDDRIRAQFAEDPHCLVYGDDGLQHENLCTHPFVSRDSVTMLGYFYPDTGDVSLTDVWLMLMYQHLGRLRYLPDVFIEHMHFLNGKAQYDETYASQYETNFPKVQQALLAHMDRLKSDTQGLREAIAGRHLLHD